MFGVPTNSKKDYQYAPLHNEEISGPRASKIRRNRLFRVLINFSLALVFIFTYGAVFFAGRWSAFAVTEHDSIQLQTVSKTFQYDENYGEPANTSNAIWRSLIPRHGGFFNHPTIAPDRSVFSVFHQLHCLDGMRQGYWAFHNAMNEGVVLDEENMHHLSTPMHFKHCVDYIRQVLMCRPDLTLEIKNPVAKGVEGFGTKHTCKNWDELITFVETWEDWGKE